MAQYNNLIGDRLDLKVVYSSSSEELRSAKNLELLPLLNDKEQVWSNLGWASDKYCTYPQTLIFEISETSALLKELRIVSHEYLIGKRMEIYVAIGDDFRTCDFRRIGHIYFSSNRQTGFTAREKKVINLDATANFFKIAITESHNTVKNMYEQVSLISVEAYGIKSVPHVSNLKVAYVSPMKTKINMPTDDPTSKFVLPKLGEWNALEAHSQISTDADVNEVDQVLLSLGLGFDLVAASRPPVTMDLATQRLLSVVEAEKDRAVEREDFVKAQKLQEQVNQLRDIGVQLIVEEENKHYAIACDDYKTASAAKKKITRMFTMREEIASENQFRRDALEDKKKKKKKRQSPSPRALPSPKRPTKAREKTLLPGIQNEPSPKLKQLKLTTKEGVLKPASTTDGVMNETSSALMIQKMHRGKINRKEFSKKKRAILNLQAVYRGNKCRSEKLTAEQKQALLEAKERRMEVEAEKESARKIQSVYRGRKVRKDLSSEQKDKIRQAQNVRIAEEKGKEKAALKIQKTYRDKQVKEENKAAAKIQASFRGKQARHEVEIKRKSLSRNERPVGAAFHGFKKVDPFGQIIVEEKKQIQPEQSKQRKRANQNDPLQQKLEEWIGSNLPDKSITLPDLLEGFERHAASQVIEAFGETVAACAWSKNWKLRVAAAGTIENNLSEIKTDVPLMFRAHCMLGERLFSDKNPSVVFKMITLSKKILSYAAMQDKSINIDLITGGLSRIFPVLLQRTGDNNKIVRDKITTYIVDLGKTIPGPSFVFKTVLEYEKTVKSVKSICGVSILMKILIETYDLKQNYGISATTVMKMVVADLKHPNPDVRTCAIELATIVHALQGTSVEHHLIGVKLSTLDMLRQSILKHKNANGNTIKQFEWADIKLKTYIQKEKKRVSGTGAKVSVVPKKKFLTRKDKIKR